MRRDLGTLAPDDRRLAGWRWPVAAAVAPVAAPDSPAGRLFALAAVLGWLLSFLMGVLQRILPFLASMHAAQGRRRPPTPSALTLTRALNWHAVAHALALALLAAGPGGLLARAAAHRRRGGQPGALCFVAFFAVLLNRLRLSRGRRGLRGAPPHRRPGLFLSIAVLQYRYSIRTRPR